MRDSNVATKYGVLAHQHINSGGLSVAVSTDTNEDGTETHHLEIGLSNYGVSQRCIIPVFSTTPNILRLIADELEANNIRDPKYMSPIIAHVTFENKEDVYFRVVGGKVVQVKREDCYSGGQSSNVGTKAAG